jgi:hypothetical protein
LITYLLIYKLKWKFPLVSIIGLVFLVLFALTINKERSSFTYSINLNQAQKNVTERFISEDSLTNPIRIPLLIKRLAYNKYYFFYKSVINEIIPFFDFESIFFQEIHPMEQKSVVLFVWPQFILFLIGIYQLLLIKNKKANGIVLSFFVLALMNYLMVASEPYRKFELLLFPIGLLISFTIYFGFLKKICFWNKSVVFFVSLFAVYGIFTNFYNLYKRPDYWLDNRPLFYEFVYKNLSSKDLEKYDLVTVTSLVGNSELYCNFYIGNCQNKNFIFDSFDLKNNLPKNNSIYAGFAGEFVGSDFKNNIINNWRGEVLNKKMNILATRSLRDTIAYKYGNDILVAEVKNEK